MLPWLSANLINIVLIVLIAAITGLLIRSLIRDRKAGKSSCGGNCASCGACGGCAREVQGCACGSCGAAETVPQK